MEAEVELKTGLELERNAARDELQSMHGLVENETQSLRFRLSSQTMELQQAKQVRPVFWRTYCSGIDELHSLI